VKLSDPKWLNGGGHYSLETLTELHNVLLHKTEPYIFMEQFVKNHN